MKNWRDVIEAVRKKKYLSNTNEKKQKNISSTYPVGNECGGLPKRHYLGEKFQKFYLTQREYDCVSYLMKGFSFKKTAVMLGISHRTVEFYVKNMRLRFKCANLRALLGCLAESEIFKK